MNVLDTNVVSELMRREPDLRVLDWIRDLLIAAIAKQHKADLATRNISDFEACGLRLINPWQ